MMPEVSPVSSPGSGVGVGSVPGQARRRVALCGDIVVVIVMFIVGVVLFGFVVVDDGVIADVGRPFCCFR